MQIDLSFEDLRCLRRLVQEEIENCQNINYISKNIPLWKKLDDVYQEEEKSRREVEFGGVDQKPTGYK